MIRCGLVPTNSRQIFLQPRLVGDRFQDGVVPVAVLEELIELRKLLVDVARYLFKQQNPSRTRVPKGFERSFRLALTSIDAGSAIPCLERLGPRPLFSVGGDTFDQALDQLLATVKAANGQERDAIPLPASLVSKFARLGRSLTAGEAIYFKKPDADEEVRYSLDTRKWLSSWSGASSYLQDVELIGSITAVDDDKSVFELRLPYGVTTKARYEPDDRSEVIEALNSRWHVRCQIAAMARYSDQDELLEVDGITTYSFFDAVDDKQRQRLATRFEEIRALRRGWYEGRGLTFSGQFLDWAERLLLALMVEEESTPFVYPMPEGELRIEWQCQDWEISTFLDRNQRAQAHALSHTTDEERTCSAQGDEFQVSERLGAFLQSLE